MISSSSPLLPCALPSLLLLIDPLTKWPLHTPLSVTIISFSYSCVFNTPLLEFSRIFFSKHVICQLFWLLFSFISLFIFGLELKLIISKTLLPVAQILSLLFCSSPWSGTFPDPRWIPLSIPSTSAPSAARESHAIGRNGSATKL